MVRSPCVIEDLTPRQVDDRLRSAAPPLLLDVREDWEWDVAAIPGSLHMPMGQITARLGELDPERDVVVVCHHGARSAQVAAFLAAAGLPRVANLAGGIDGWSVDVDPTIARYH